MKSWRSSIRVGAPADRVWRLLADFRHWPEWGLSVRAVDPPVGLVAQGLRGRVQAAVGVWLPFEITDVREGSSWTWRVAGIDATDHLVEATPDGCVVTFTAPTWAPFYVPVLASSLRTLRRLAETESDRGH